MCLEEAGESLILKNIRSIDGDTPAGIACVLRLQAQAMPAARSLIRSIEYKCSSEMNPY